MKVIYDDLSFEDEFEKEVVFEDLFDNEYANNKYIITGDIGLWDGVRKDVHHPRVFDSIAEAIIVANDGFNGYITVSEGKYGKLLLDICHHDGSNHLEIRELTKLGEEMDNNYKSVQEIINRKGSTRNVRFLKNYF